MDNANNRRKVKNVLSNMLGDLGIELDQLPEDMTAEIFEALGDVDDKYILMQEIQHHQGMVEKYDKMATDVSVVLGHLGNTSIEAGNTARNYLIALRLQYYNKRRNHVNWLNT